MKSLIRISVCSILIAISVTLCLAQDKIEISTDPPPPAAKLPVVKEVGKVQVVYNERLDKIIVQTPSMPVQGNWRNGINLRASFESARKNIIAPSKITLTFFSAANDRTYADNRALTIFLDEKQAFSDIAKYERGNTNGEVCLISVKQDIPYDLFLKIINAKKVRMQIGPTEFELKEDSLDALRDIKKAIESSSEKSSSLPEKSDNQYQIAEKTIVIPPPNGFAEAYSTVKSIKDFFNALEGSGNELVAVFLPAEDVEKEKQGERTDLFFYTKVSVRKNLKAANMSAAEFDYIISFFKTKGMEMLDVNNPRMKQRLAETERKLSDLSKKDVKGDLSQLDILGEIERNQNLYSFMMLTKSNMKVGNYSDESISLVTMSFLRVRQKLIYVTTVKEYKSKDDVEMLKNFSIKWNREILAANQR